MPLNLPPMDLATVFFSLAIVSVPLGLVSLILARSMPQMGLVHWGKAMLIFACACLLIYLRGHAPAVLTFLLANSLILVALAYVLLAYAQLLEVRAARGLLGVITGVGLGGLLGVQFFAWPFWTAVVGMGLAALLHSLYIVFLLFRHCAHLHQGLAWFSKLAMASVALVFAARVAQALGTGVAENPVVFVPPGLQGVLLLMGLVLYAISTLTFVALVNERHRGEVLVHLRRDALTGLYTRTAFYEQEAELSGAGAYAVVLLDMDHFKAINDQYGHAGGDLVLAYLGRHLQGAVRLTDLAVRYGGEEFLILLRDCSGPDAAQFAERMVQEARQQAVRFQDNHTLRYSLSAGSAVRRAGPDGLEPLDAVIARADKALYQAKARGRNCAVAAE